MTIFTKANGEKFLVVLAAVMVGLAAHQMYVAKHIAKQHAVKA